MSPPAPERETAERLAPANPWVLSLTPYGWLPFLNGDQTIRGRTVAIGVNPIEVMEHLETAPWMSYVEARRGPLAFYNDIFYANLGISASRARSFDGASIDARASVDFEQAVVELGGAYEIGKWWSGGGGGQKDPKVLARYTAIDVLAGVRYWHQDMAINLAITGVFDLDGLVVSGSRAIARSGSVDWVDPLVGLRIRHQLAPGQELVVRADIGGFGVGSDFSWNALAAYSWQIAVRDGVTYSGVLGYRALDVDYDKGSGRNRYEYAQCWRIMAPYRSPPHSAPCGNQDVRRRDRPPAAGGRQPGIACRSWLSRDTSRL